MMGIRQAILKEVSTGLCSLSIDIIISPCSRRSMNMKHHMNMLIAAILIIRHSEEHKRNKRTISVNCIYSCRGFHPRSSIRCCFMTQLNVELFYRQSEINYLIEILF